MPTVTYQPTLSWWSHVWRNALVLTISGVAWFQVAYWQWDHHRWWFWTDLTLGLITMVLLVWRRRFPVAIASITNVLTVVSFSSSGPATLALASLATRRRWREIAPVGVLAFIAGITVEGNNPVDKTTMAFVIPLIVLIVALTIGWGMYIGSRRELLATLRERAETAEREQSARLAQARTAERSRIAREMHDVLAHRISLVTMHAGALAYRKDLSPEEVRVSAEIIQHSSHQALIELREVLGLMRQGPGDSDPELPQPSAGDLPELMIEARRSGMRIETEHGIEVDTIPEALGRTLYRIVQEGLTNARKHAPDTRVIVNLAGGPGDGLTVEVRNPLPIGSSHDGTPASGLGLIGLAERTELSGGRLSHGVSPTKEFVLGAWLPWPVKEVTT